VFFTGVRIDYKSDCKLGFGEYVQVYAENNITNTMQSRTYGVLSMGTSGNIQGTYRVAQKNARLKEYMNLSYKYP